MIPGSLFRAMLAAIGASFVLVPALAQQAEPALPAASAASAPLPPLPAGETVSIPMAGGGMFGGTIGMVTQVYRPPGDGPFPVVVFSHGRAPDAVARAHLKAGVSSAQLRFWLERGDAVVAPVRPGYGATGLGSDPENSGAHFDAMGHCTSNPDYRKTAEAAGRTVDATLAWLRSQPWADTHHVLLAGQSVGGLTTVTAAAHPQEGVVGYINFAGGTGGNPERSPGASCDPGQMEALYASFGRTTTVPSLWVYAMNDQYWGADVPVAWHAAFAKGGSKTTFVHAPAVADGNGHGLSSHAQRLWAPYVNDFLATIDFPPVRH